MRQKEEPMRGRKPAITLELAEPVRQQLEAVVRRTTTRFGMARRARAILCIARGMPYLRTAEVVGLTERHVRTWVRRFVQEGMDGLVDRLRSGRPPGYPLAGVSP